MIVWLNNCIYFGMRPRKEQRDLCWGDLEWKRDSKGVRFVELCRQRQAKTRTGKNLRNYRAKKPQMYENKSNLDPWSINTYLAYRAHRPAVFSSDESPFYLAVNIKVPNKEGQQWYKGSPIGLNSLQNMLKRIVENSGMETDKRLVNHRTRKHLVPELVDDLTSPSAKIMQKLAMKTLLR